MLARRSVSSNTTLSEMTVWERRNRCLRASNLANIAARMRVALIFSAWAACFLVEIGRQRRNGQPLAFRESP